jgi:hypothetical protein
MQGRNRGWLTAGRLGEWGVVTAILQDLCPVATFLWVAH